MSFKEYKHPIEQFYFENEDENFLSELKNFIGFITRKYCHGFRQSGHLYDQFRSDVIQEIYGYLRTPRYSGEFTTKIKKNGKIKRCLIKGEKFTHYEMTVKYLKEEYKRDMDFTSYLYTQIRGELTKFMYHWNIRRKIEISLNFHEVPFKEKDSYLKAEIENIIRKLKMNAEDKIEDMIDYFMHYLHNNLDISKFKNIYQLKIIMWELNKIAKLKNDKKLTAEEEFNRNKKLEELKFKQLKIREERQKKLEDQNKWRTIK